MGGASSTQRGSKAAQSQTILRESANTNTPKDTAQAVNIAKDSHASLNIEQDLKKDNVAPTESMGPDNATASILLQTINPATKFPEPTASFFQASVNSTPGVNPESANAASPTKTSQPTKAHGPPTDQGRKVLGQINTRGLKMDTQGEKKTRRGRGKRKGKNTRDARDDTENIPPSTNQQPILTRRRRAYGTGYVDIGTKPAPRRGRARSRVGGAETANVANYIASQSVEELMEGVKTTGRDTDVDKGWEHGRRRTDAIGRPKHRGRRRLPSQQGEPTGRVEEVEIPKADKKTGFKTGGGLASDEDQGSLLPCGETKLPEATKEGDVSIVHPLPSSTRRRAKEYFQRRTRERSVDAVARHARPPRPRHVSMAEQGMRSSAEFQGSIENASATARSALNGSGDQFVFDPEASPFTPNATSSPKQVSSLSSIGVQSFSSPTPLPSHGNRKVVPLVLPDVTSNRGNHRQETKRDSTTPITSHDLAAYTYAGANPAQAHIQAEQISLLRLQAYYSWLASSIPTTTRVGITTIHHQSEHMEMSGGGGGLSGGVALGQQAQTQIQGLGKSRNASSAYAHPKEHVIFSPRDYERRTQTQHTSQSVLQKEIVQSEKGEPEREEERRKCARTWGLRQMGAKEIGWSWGRNGTSVEE